MPGQTLDATSATRTLGERSPATTPPPRGKADAIARQITSFGVSDWVQGWTVIKSSDTVDARDFPSSFG